MSGHRVKMKPPTPSCQPEGLAVQARISFPGPSSAGRPGVCVSGLEQAQGSLRHLDAMDGSSLPSLALALRSW